MGEGNVCKKICFYDISFQKFFRSGLCVQKLAQKLACVPSINMVMSAASFFIAH